MLGFAGHGTGMTADAGALVDDESEVDRGGSTSHQECGVSAQRQDREGGHIDVE
jgi:hypothetical protein